MNRFIVSVGVIGIACGGLLTAHSRAVASPAGMQSPGEAGSTQSGGGNAPVAGGVTVQIDIPKDSGGAEGVKVDADTAAKNYVLTTKKWELGFNRKKSPGFYVVISSARIHSGDADTFAERRSQAATEAMLGAKIQIAEYLANQVSTELERVITTRSPGAAAKEASTPKDTGMESIVTKLTTLANHEIDNLLRARGIDPSAATEAQRAELAKQIVGRKEFKQAVKSEAETQVVGLQAFRTFESIGAGEGKIAVVAVYSDKYIGLQRALTGQTGSTTPKGAPGDPISQWANEQGADVLLYTHGAQVRVNETGELVLVGFGQSSKEDMDGLGEQVARDEARLLAQGELRNFLGSLITSEQSSSRASTMESYSDKTSAFTSQSESKARAKEVADKLSMPGMLEVFTWSNKHPQSELQTYGSVVVLSVSEMIEANELRDQFNAVGAAAGGAGGSGIKRPAGSAGGTVPNKPVRGNTSGAGAEGVDP
jgi:hypothetical protein